MNHGIKPFYKCGTEKDFTYLSSGVAKMKLQQAKQKSIFLLLADEKNFLSLNPFYFGRSTQ